MKPTLVSKKIYDYYLISKHDADGLKSAFNSLGDRADEAVRANAIVMARERTDIYAMPAKWSAHPQDDGTIVIRRIRNVDSLRVNRRTG